LFCRRRRNAPFQALLIAVAARAVTAAACAPDVGQNGFQAVDAKPTDIVAGTTPSQTVLAKLGSPSTTSTFEPTRLVLHQPDDRAVHFYNRAHTKRDVTEITFNKKTRRSAVNNLHLKDGKVVA
jgi:outer membrane protein assembly factor BamE (lipoprotein component of BamABCDE complex)